jgi:hypothetical protein
MSLRPCRLPLNKAQNDTVIHMLLMKPVGLPGLMVAALAAFAVPTNAGVACPELERLMGAFLEAWQAKAPPCDCAWRLSLAAKAWIEYTRRNVEPCGISDHLLSQCCRR